MALFGKKEEDFDEEKLQKREEKENKKFGKSFKDLNFKNKKKRKEPPKLWGKKERLIVLIVFIATVVTALILTISASSMGRQNITKLNPLNINFDSLNIFGEKTIIIYKSK